MGKGKLSFVEHNYYGLLFGGIWLPGLPGSFFLPIQQVAKALLTVFPSHLCMEMDQGELGCLGAMLELLGTSGFFGDITSHITLNISPALLGWLILITKGSLAPFCYFKQRHK